MIEVLRAACGADVLKQDGRLLASRHAPGEESRAWLARRMSLLQNVKTLFVLGAGSGYHIREIVQTCEAQVIVVENNAEVVTAVERLQQFAAERVQFVVVSSLKDLRAHEVVRKSLVGSYLVLDWPASFSTNRTFFTDCRQFLLGRDWGSLTWQWQLRGFAPLFSQPRAGQSEKPLSIVDLDSADHLSTREGLLIKALRELVK